MTTYNTYSASVVGNTKSDTIFWGYARPWVFKALDTGYILSTVGQLWPRRLP